MDLRNMFRYMGVPLRDMGHMFGDNESVVHSSTVLEAKLHKRTHIPSFHRMREFIATGKLTFMHMHGENNPADILSEHWAFSDAKQTLRPLSFPIGQKIE